MDKSQLFQLINWTLVVLLLVYLAVFVWNLPKMFLKPEEKKVECKQTEYVRSIIKRIEYQMDVSEVANEPLTITDWEEKIGILLSREDAEAIVNYFYSTVKNENKTS